MSPFRGQYHRSYYSARSAQAVRVHNLQQSRRISCTLRSTKLPRRNSGRRPLLLRHIRGLADDLEISAEDDDEDQIRRTIWSRASGPGQALSITTTKERYLAGKDVSIAAGHHETTTVLVWTITTWTAASPQLTYLHNDQRLAFQDSVRQNSSPCLCRHIAGKSFDPLLSQASCRSREG